MVFIINLYNKKDFLKKYYLKNKNLVLNKVMDSIKFYRTKEECYINQGDYDQTKHILLSADVLENQGIKEFVLIPYDINYLQNIITQTEKKERNYYTIIPTANTLQKLKFDIDCHKSKLSEEEWLDMSSNLRLMSLIAIRNYLNKIYGIKLYNECARFSIDNSSTDEKISYHIVLQDIFVISCNETKEFIRQLKADDFFSKYTKYIDSAPNTSFQNWRLRGSCKKGKSNFKVGEEGSLEDSLPFASPSQLKNLNGKMRILPSIILINQYNPLETSPIDEKCLDGELENLVSLIKESIDNGKHSLCDDEYPTKMCYDNFKKLIFAISRVSGGQAKELCYSLFNLYRHSDDIKDIANKFIDKMLVHSEYGWTKASLHFWAMENSKYSEIFKDQCVARSIEKFFSKPSDDNIKNWIDDHSEYVNDLDFSNDCNVILIKAGLGCGKTSSIIRHINKTNPKRVIILSPRQSYAKSICNEYNEKVTIGEKFTCYLDLDTKGKKTIPFINRLVISMESLRYLLTLSAGQIKEFDLTIIDECEANLVQHCSRTTNKEHINANIEVFKHLLKSKKEIIFADAFLSFKTYNFLKRLDIKYNVFNYTRKMKERTCVEIKGKFSVFINIFETSLHKNEKNYCVVSSKKKAECLYKHMCITFPDKKFLLYTGGLEKANDVRIEWSDVHAIFTTTTITVGINFDLKNVFHNIFIYISARSRNKVADIIQSHFRVRNIINNKLYFFLDTIIPEYLPTNYTIIKRGVHWREDTFLQKHTWFERGGPEFLQLVANCEFEQNMSIIHLRPMFLRYLEECGYKFINNDVNNEVILDFDIELSKDEFEDEDFNVIQNINAFDAKDLIQKRSRGYILSRSEKLQLEKYIFISTFTQNSEVFLEREYVVQLWAEWNNFGKSKITMLRKEKKVLENIRTIREIYEEETNKCNLGCIQSNKLLRLEWMLRLCKELGLKNSQDTSTIIPNEKLKSIHLTLKSEADNIRKSFNFQDRRTNVKEDLSFEDFIDMINTAFKKYGYTKLSRGKQRRIRVEGKQIQVSNYKLEANTIIETDSLGSLELGKTIFNELDVSSVNSNG
ncbi:MAG: hypothetical protein EBW68_00400 [Actinobacteria bacterium]|nr:hypothetical protein [Actinomycetota bacterium]